MNLILLVVLVSEACIGICAWLSPQWLRSVAAHLLARADVLELTRKEERRRLQFWNAELGLEARDNETPSASGSLPVRVLARH